MKRVRVLVANQPRLMRELVMATISDQPDIELVGEVVDEGDLIEVVEQVQPDVLILAMDEPQKSLGQCGFLLGRYPQMRILALAPEQNLGIFYWAISRYPNKAAGKFGGRNFECGSGTSDAGGSGAELRHRRDDSPAHRNGSCSAWLIGGIARLTAICDRLEPAAQAMMRFSST